MTALELLAVKLPDPEIMVEVRQMAVEEIGHQIQSYCHITEIPPALYFTQANMAADLLRYEREVARPLDAATENVSSISEGDTSISFGKSEDRERLLGEHRQTLDRVVFDYRVQLQAFRKVSW